MINKRSNHNRYITNGEDVTRVYLARITRLTLYEAEHLRLSKVKLEVVDVDNGDRMIPSCWSVASRLYVVCCLFMTSGLELRFFWFGRTPRKCYKVVDRIAQGRDGIVQKA
jgi:uncharacterized protein (UPF0212 family)